MPDKTQTDADSSDTKCPTCGRDDFASRKGMKCHHKIKHGVSISGEVVECSWCGGEKKVKPVHAKRFETHFCTDSCESRWKSNNWLGDSHPRSNRINVNCSHCGHSKKVKPSRYEMFENHFCDMACKGSWLSQTVVGENHPRYAGGRFPHGPGFGFAKKETVRDRQDRCCAGCGIHEFELAQRLPVHHIRKARTIDDPRERNHEDNLVALCGGTNGSPNCHATYERMSPLVPQIETPHAATATDGGQDPRRSELVYQYASANVEQVTESIASYSDSIQTLREPNGIEARFINSNGTDDDDWPDTDDVPSQGAIDRFVAVIHEQARTLQTSEDIQQQHTSAVG